MINDANLDEPELIAAVREKDFDRVEELCQNPDNLISENNKGQTALDIAQELASNTEPDNIENQIVELIVNYTVYSSQKRPNINSKEKYPDIWDRCQGYKRKEYNALNPITTRENSEIYKTVAQTHQSSDPVPGYPIPLF